jgi:hypothetical protein
MDFFVASEFKTILKTTLSYFAAKVISEVTIFINT